MKKFSPLKITRSFGYAVSVLVLVLAGCTMIPKYKQPAAPLATSWPTVPGYTNTMTTNAVISAADIGWQDFFLDARLQKLIRLALTNNPSLQAAAYNVEETHYLYHVQQDALIPTVDANASATRQRVPNVYSGPGSTNGSSGSSAIVYNEYNVGLGMTSYEVDLFGRIRSLTRQALETYFATEQARRSAQLALVAQVGTAYLTEQEASEQLAISREMLKAARESFDLTKRSFDAGVLSQFDLNNASTELQNATVAESGYAQQLAEASDNLTLLAGEPLPEDLVPTGEFDTNMYLADIPAGLPSDLLQRRPDVLEAEHQLKAANANIGAARAAFFPTITLTGNAGYASTTLQNLFAPGSTAWGITPQVSWPVFSLGTAYHALKAQQAVKKMQAANYVSTVQEAFKEVADALAVHETVQSQLADDEDLVKADQQSYDLTQAGFKGGVNSALDLDVTLQTYDSARLTLINAQYSRLVSLINLYQALGGGWTPQTIQTASK
jgi:outer membrane protein, multidrug efflux system